MAPSPEERLDRFVRLLVCHQGRLYQYVRMLTPRERDVEDILQQAFLVMWQKFDESYADASFYGWATRVAYLEVLKARSRGRRNLPLLDQEVLDKIVGEESEEPEFLANLKTLLDGCLKKLPPNDRELIERRYQPGVLVQRLAEELGRPVNSVSSSLRASAGRCGSASTRRLPIRPTPGGGRRDAARLEAGARRPVGKAH